MTIKSNAQSEELNNPFYIANRRFCEEFERYIIGRNGKVKGKFNVWTYFVSGRINTPKEWTLSYKKSNYTSLGMIPILQSKKQYKDYVLALIAKWETRLEDSGTFKIRRKSTWGFLVSIFHKHVFLYPENQDYVVYSNGGNQELIQKLSSVLRPFFDSGEIFQINLKRNILSIQISTDHHHFDTFEKIEKTLH